MKVRALFIALALALTAIAVPSMADHVSEPTAPVTGLTVALYKYTDRANTLMRCDGTDQITFDTVRVEPGVSVASKPSEHFTVHQSVTFTERLNGKASTTFRQWGSLWRHQNAPAHSVGGGSLDRPWEVAETNQYLEGRLGFWIIEHRVIGEESGALFEHRCVFERVAG